MQAAGAPGRSPVGKPGLALRVGAGDRGGRAGGGGRMAQSPHSESVRLGLPPHFCNLLVDGPANSRYTPPHSLESPFQGFPIVLPNCLDDRSQ